MKIIQQNSQLSDEELKAVLSGNEEMAKKEAMASLDLTAIQKDVQNLADQILDHAKASFQVLLEQIIAEQFFDFLDEIREKGGNDSRNGYYKRKIHSVMGDFEIMIPRARYDNFVTSLLKKYGHELGDIEDRVIDLYLGGMTEREVVDALAKMDGIGLSRERVGQIVRKTVGNAAKFNEEPIPDCPVVYLDATYIPMKRAYCDGKSVEKEGILVALGICPDGTKRILGFQFGQSECLERWKMLLRSLRERGLHNPRLFVTDGLSGMPDAVREVFPGTKHQRCTVHYKRNLMEYVNEKDKPKIVDDFRAILTKDSKEQAMEAFRDFKSFWIGKYRGIRGMLDKTDDNIFTFMEFPKELRGILMTSNAIESFNAKLKRETKKRILANSEDNATIVVTHICESYNRSCGRRIANGLPNVEKPIREGMGFVF